MRGTALDRIERHRQRQFERLVVDALDRLPSDVLTMLDNVDVVVEDWPSQGQASRNGDGTETMFGLYEGIPLTQRGHGYSMVLPDKITIFRGPLERAFRSRTELMRQVRITVAHELGHHLGFDEDRLEELGLA